MFMTKARQLQAALLAVCAGMLAPMANATPPAYITDAITTATTTFTEYISASAPGVLGITVILAGFFLVVKLVKRATH